MSTPAAPTGDQPINPMDAVWKALSDPTRRALLDAVKDGPRTTGQLADAVRSATGGMSRFGVMKHLGVLESAGLMITRKEGRQKWHHLNAAPLRMIYERWVSTYEDRWAGSLIRLKQRVEERAHAPRTEREHDMGAKFLEQPARVAVSEIEIEIDAPKDAVYRAWFDDPNLWFYESEESSRETPTRCEERMGGRFYIELPDGGFNVIGEITMLKPNHKIRMRGDCTMPQAVLMNMTIAFEETNGRTKVSIDHRMSGEVDDDFPDGFVEGWMDGLVKLKELVESRSG